MKSPWELRLREIIFDIGGILGDKKFKAVQIGARAGLFNGGTP